MLTRSRLRRMGESHGVDSGGKCGREIVSGSSPFDSLPEDYISNIVSFTSPRDACVAASVSKTFESAVKSDVVWEKFLPAEYESLVPRSRDFSSKKELYFALCDDPVLIDDGTKSFWLEKSSGKKCIMLSAINITIIWGDTPRYLLGLKKLLSFLMYWFEIRGRTNTRVLSPRTRYLAYIVFKKMDYCYGFEDVAIEAGVGVVGREASTRLVCFDAGAAGQPPRRRRRKKIVKPKEREDGWMEIELGGFFNEGGLTNFDEVEMSALETKRLNSKTGLISFKELKSVLQKIR